MPRMSIHVHSSGHYIYLGLTLSFPLNHKSKKYFIKFILSLLYGRQTAITTSNGQLAISDRVNSLCSHINIDHVPIENVFKASTHHNAYIDILFMPLSSQIRLHIHTRWLCLYYESNERDWRRDSL